MVHVYLLFGVFIVASLSLSSLGIGEADKMLTERMNVSARIWVCDNRL